RDMSDPSGSASAGPALTFSRFLVRALSEPNPEDRAHQQVGHNRESLVDPEELARAALEDRAGHARRHEESEPHQEPDHEPSKDSGRQPDVGLTAIFKEQ